MDNTQLSKPLLGDFKSLERAALLSMIVDQEFKPNQIKPTTVDVGGKKAQIDPMMEALTNISVVFNKQLPAEVNMPYTIYCLVKLSDEAHFVASAREGVALYIDSKTMKFEEKKISDSLWYVVPLKGEQKAVFSSTTALYEVELPSLLPTKEKTFDFGTQILKMVISYDRNSLYVLLATQKIFKVNPENFQEREVFLEGDFVKIALSNNGDFAAFSRDGKLTLINLQTSSQKEIKVDLVGPTFRLEFSNSQSKILVTSSHSAALVNLNPLEVLKVHSVEEGMNDAAIANDDNTLLYGGFSGKLKFWDFKNNEQLSEVQIHNRLLRYIKLSADGKLIYTCSREGKFCTTNFPEFTKELSTKANSFKVSPLGTALILSSFGEFKKWNLITNKREEIGVIKDLEINNYGVVDDNTIIIFNLNEIIKHNFATKENQKILLIDSDLDYIHDWAFSSDRALFATGGRSQKVFLWDLKTMKKVKEFKGSDVHICKIQFFEKSNVIAAGNGAGDVYFWSIATGELIVSLNGEKDQSVISIGSFENDENVVIGYTNGSVLVFNWTSKMKLATLKAGEKLLKICITKDEKSMITVAGEGKILFWNLLTFTVLFFYDIQREMLSFELTTDEKYLAYKIASKVETIKNKSGEEIKLESDADNLFIKKNPLATDIVVAAGPGSEPDYMKYVIELMNNKAEQHIPEYDNWVIMPYKVNTLHLYAYFNYQNYLRLALNAGGSLFNTNFGDSALSFAVKKQFSGCVSAIVSSLEKILKSNPNALKFISNECIVGLNRFGYPSLTKFYELIYTPYTGKFVKFVSESISTPIYYHSKEIYPLESNFLQSNQNKKEGKSVKCMVTSLPLPLINGSKASTDFLDSLEECPNSAIFTTKLIQDILDNKWDELKWAMYWQAIIYTIYMILLSVYVLYWIGQFSPLLVIFLFSLLLTSYEVFQFVTSPSEYIEDIWNYIDAIRTILAVVYTAIVWSEEKTSDLGYQILAGLVIVSWTRGISYFRIFKNTRYMVNLITQVIIDITSFLILLFYSTIAFAFIFLVMDKEDPKLIDYIKMSYRLDLGDFDASSMSSTQWVCLFLATMINMIIMLNLLISIMGDTFGRVQENAEIADRKELIGMITEIETLMFWKKNITERSYFQSIVGEESEEAEQNMNTRFQALKEKMKSYHLQNQKRFENVENKFENLEKGLEKRFENQEKKFENLEKTMEKIWNKLESEDNIKS